VPDFTAADADRAIAAAAAGFETWRQAPAAKRAAALKKWHRAILANVDELGRIMTLECGKPLAEAKGEVLYAASFVEWYAEEAVRIQGSVNMGTGRDRQLLTLRSPVGVAACITPWNFPAAMITRKIAPALAAGCAVVIKPAEETPLTALALAALAHDCFPPGVVNVVTASRDHVAQVGDALCASTTVRALSFTGSTAVGKMLYSKCAQTVKKLGLELGGNAPFIICADADVGVAVDAVMAAKFRNAGQTCVCPDRFIVHDSKLDEFKSALLERLALVQIGNGRDFGVTIGPLINAAAAQRIGNMVQAFEETGKALLGGTAAATELQKRLGPAFYPPTVVEVTDAAAACWAGETFGPVVALMRFNDLDDAVRLANEGTAGLAAYVMSADSMRAVKLAERLDYGMVTINTGALGGVAAPFGGMKESGLGREGARHGLDEYLEDKAIAIGGLA